MVDSGRVRLFCARRCGACGEAGIGAGGVVGCRAEIPGWGLRSVRRCGGRASLGGFSRQGTVSGWKSRYEASGLAGLADRSRRPASCPHQASAEVETAVCELRRKHPRWGPRRIAFVGARGSGPGSGVPSRHGPSIGSGAPWLCRAGVLDRRSRFGYKRWRGRPCRLWQDDIVGGACLFRPVRVS
nr:helix-turn-helix domain-containing protein [Streptomyces sp. DHE17-7]